jgi:hypothetical protein
MLLDKALRRADWMNDKRVTAYPAIFLAVYALIVVVWMSGSSLFPKLDGVGFRAILLMSMQRARLRFCSFSA